MSANDFDDLQAPAAMLPALTDKELVYQYLHLKAEGPAIDTCVREMGRKIVDFYPRR